jgi:apolipoprotein D and lipocalin family protein
MKIIIVLISILLLTSMVYAAKKTYHIPAVKNFELNKYLGTWYEIARMPHFFEKDMEQVTADYSLREDGKIKVLNKGYKATKQMWKESEGKAWVPDENKPSELKVSFVWFISSDYRIIYLEEDYSLAIVTSKNTKYFWMLSRTPTIDEQYYNKLIKRAAGWGFDVSKFIRVKQK